MLKDKNQRLQATDPLKSFLVQAPAGSGKTELLTQRFLRLLSFVTAPEQIVALTFTRKAANEMRTRILLMLHNVSSGKVATSALQEQTYSYAKAALKQNEKYSWQLLEQPSRLRIITIDSLFQSFTQAMPQHQEYIAFAQVANKPKFYYQEAAHACFTEMQSNKDLHFILKTLLTHLDNRQDKLLELLSELLASREQWSASFGAARFQEKAEYEQVLDFIEKHELNRLKKATAADIRQKLCNLAREIALLETSPDEPIYLLRNWLTFEEIDRKIAHGLARLLLTSQNTLRKRFDSHVGLKRGSCLDVLYDYLKTTSQELLHTLAKTTDFLSALIKVRSLPPPYYEEEQWQVLQAIFSILPILLDKLKLIFKQHSEVDFTAISEQAFAAIHSNYGDMNLYFEHEIHHLLVDEFQDTSIKQFQFLNKLVSHWKCDDAKTIFLVGDPMQSIYRFRAAEVGLFLKAKQHGLGSTPLVFLKLCSNFRSTSTIVDWINQQFKDIFPDIDDIESGAISFHTSEPVLDTSNHSFIKASQFSSKSHEADALIAVIKEELETHPKSKIAILVKTRSLLPHIIRLLRHNAIAFQGIEIESLSNLTHLCDLKVLTEALLMPANRLSWLALLRGPFCGLSLDDLLKIANFNPQKSIYNTLSQLYSSPTTNLINLSNEGLSRVLFVYTILQDALSCRRQTPLIDWITNVFNRLHGNELFGQEKQADLAQFWLLLEGFIADGKELDLERFNEEFDILYSQRVSPSRLQIMTIHKSKGLEFDCVIIPSLSAKKTNPSRPILRWIKLPCSEKEELLLVSPIKAANHEHNLLYEYLQKLDAEKESYELQRLLYVAVTRTKKRLYLFDSSEKNNKGTFRSLLKENIFNITENNPYIEKLDDPLPMLYKLPQSFYLNQPPPAPLYTNKLMVERSQSMRNFIGIITHELLQWICDNHENNIDKLPWPLVKSRLTSLGLDEIESLTAYQTIYQQIQNLFKSEVGQWICKSHPDERNEYHLLINEQDIIKTYIIDRTFCYNGQQWVIDFKTGIIDTKMLHQRQVNNYARLLALKLAKTPIYCGLYYLASGNWTHWVYP